MADVRPEVLVLDLRRVGFIDCVGLSLGRTAHGVEVRLDRTRHPRVQRIFELAEYEGVLPFVDDPA